MVRKYKKQIKSLTCNKTTELKSEHSSCSEINVPPPVTDDTTTSKFDNYQNFWQTDWPKHSENLSSSFDSITNIFAYDRQSKLNEIKAEFKELLESFKKAHTEHLALLNEREQLIEENKILKLKTFSCNCQNNQIIDTGTETKIDITPSQATTTQNAFTQTVGTSHTNAPVVQTKSTNVVISPLPYSKSTTQESEIDFQFVRIIIYGVHDNIGLPNIIEAIYQKIKDTIPSLNVISKSTCKNSIKVNWIIELPTNIAKELLMNKDLVINSKFYPIKQFIQVKRCFVCQRLGHIANFCENDRVCAICGDSHKSTECSGSPKCVNCQINNKINKYNLDIYHPSFSPQCMSVKYYIQDKRSLLYNSLHKTGTSDANII